MRSQDKISKLLLLCIFAIVPFSVFAQTNEDRQSMVEILINSAYNQNIPGLFVDQTNLGPTMSVGLHEYERDDLEDDAAEITATNAPYNILDEDGDVIATVAQGVTTKVKYTSNGQMRVYDSISEEIVDGEVVFEATDDISAKTIIFDVNRPSSSFDRYRHSLRLRYNDTYRTIWLINDLPLEQYTWGMGEITGTGSAEYNKVMTTAYRTYGQWKINYSTKFAVQGFIVDATPGNQLYYGYDWEIAYPRIRQAAEATRGIVVHDKFDTVAIIPYSSWTDGRTRSWDEHWGDPYNYYTHCQSVSDPYGKHPTKSTAQLQAEGNHMVGLSANGALSLAQDHGKNWTYIFNYYFDEIDLKLLY